MSEDTTDNGKLRSRLHSLPSKNKYVIGIIVFVFLAILPTQVGPITMLDLTGALYFAIFAMSWDVVSGYTGKLSFGHSFIFAIGGYTAALMTLDFGMDPAVSIVIGTLAAIVGGVIIGAPSLRLEGPYFSIVTFLLPAALLDLFQMYSDTFGGELGLSSPANLLEAGGQIATITTNYYLALVVVSILFILLYVITRSNTGEVFTAIREDEITVAASGINPAKFKLFAFLLSAAVGGFGAALFVHTPVGNANPTQLVTVAVSVNVLLATILGGIGTIVGAALGGVLFYMLQIMLSDMTWTIPVLGVSPGDFDLVIFSLLILIVIYVLPDGILGLMQKIKHRLTEGNKSTRADGGTTTLRRIINQYEKVLRGDEKK